MYYYYYEARNTQWNIFVRLHVYYGRWNISAAIRRADTRFKYKQDYLLVASFRKIIYSQPKSSSVHLQLAYLHEMYDKLTVFFQMLTSRRWCCVFDVCCNQWDESGHCTSALHASIWLPLEEMLPAALQGQPVECPQGSCNGCTARKTTLSLTVIAFCFNIIAVEGNTVSWHTCPRYCYKCDVIVLSIQNYINLI